jgi:hypothetical protein
MMVSDIIRRQLAHTFARAVNIMLTAEGLDYRVRGDVILSRRNGYTVIAIRECLPDEVEIAPPIVHIRP